MIKLCIKAALLKETIDLLKEFKDKERVVLWMGHRTDHEYFVKEIFLPLQYTEEDYFNIPEEGMQQIMTKLKVTRQLLVAQIHTHPFEAFHSAADDRWAIVRHLNAYSIVLPCFASSTDLDNFEINAAIFVLTRSNDWVQVDNNNIIIL